MAFERLDARPKRYVLPVLYGDRLVAKADVKADRKENVLTVPALHMEVGATAADVDASRSELQSLAEWLKLDKLKINRTVKGHYQERRVSISFDRAAAIYDETRGGEQRGKLCAEALEPWFASSGLTVEIGVGTGLVGAAFQAGGRCVVGVDISVQMLRRARDRKLAVARADALALPFASESVDDAYSVWVLHLVADPAAVLSEVMRVLRPGGRYVTELTSIYDREHDDIALILREMDLQLRGGQPPRDDPKRIVALAERAGFRLVEIVERTTDVFRESPNESAEGIERRDLCKLWDLDTDSWQAIVEPALAALRALPEPTRQRERRAVHEIIVLEKPQTTAS